ncbi:MAG: hypothetical protein ACKO7R_05480, partial [Pseudanabaena sp.]
ILNLSSSTVLTPIGTVNINAVGFNGNLTNTSLSITNILIASVPNPFTIPGKMPLAVDWLYTAINGSNQFQFVGTTNGTSPNGTFTNAPTTINFSAAITSSTAVAGIFAAPVSSGSITLPAPPPPVVPTCTDCLIVRPDILISNSTFPSPDSQEPEYRQEYKNDFSTSSFSGGRILALEDK